MDLLKLYLLSFFNAYNLINIPDIVFKKIVFASLWGVFICSLVVVCLYGLFDLSNDQFLVFIKIIKSRVAVKFIEDVYKFKRTKLSNKRKLACNKRNLIWLQPLKNLTLPEELKMRFQTILSETMVLKSLSIILAR